MVKKCMVVFRSRKLLFRAVTYCSCGFEALLNSALAEIMFIVCLFLTEPIVSPLVSEKPDSPKTIDTISHFPVKFDSSL